MRKLNTYIALNELDRVLQTESLATFITQQKPEKDRYTVGVVDAPVAVIKEWLRETKVGKYTLRFVEFFNKTQIELQL